MLTLWLPGFIPALITAIYWLTTFENTAYPRSKNQQTLLTYRSVL